MESGVKTECSLSYAANSVSFALHNRNDKMISTTRMTHPRTFAAAIALSVVLIAGYSGAQTVRCTTWNLEWLPNGSAKETSTAQQEQRIKEAADVLRPINPDILLVAGGARL